MPHWETGDDIRQRELQRFFFYECHWCDVGLEAEVPEPGSVKRTTIGERSVTLVHGSNGWRFAERVCVYDSKMIPNSIIYPI